MKKWMLAVAVAGVAYGASAGEYDVRAEGLTASFVETGWWRLASLDGLVTPAGRNYASTNRISVFSIELTSAKDFADVKSVCAQEAKRREAVRTADGLKIVYSDFAERLEQVVCTVRADGDRLRWRIALTPKAGFAATKVDYPQVLLAPKLDKGTALVHGGRQWGLVHNPGQTWDPSKWQGVGLVQPGNLFAQFYGYYDADGGFYSAAEDAEAHAKALQVYRTGQGLQSSWSWRDWIDSVREIPYDLVTAAFRGPVGETTDWYDAADLYRAWARRQRWCKTPFRDRADLPAWLRSAVPIVRFYRSWYDSPAQIRGWIEQYWRKRFPRMPLCGATWGWEKLGNWVTPDYFPLYPDDATFAKVVQAFRDNDVRFFPWPSGYNWTLTKGKRDDGTYQYESREAFAKMAHLAIRERKGDVFVKHPSWYQGGEMPVLCRGDKRTRAWWTATVADGLFARGAELIQFDQVNGGRHDPCWSRDHGHCPGAGRWWAESMFDQMDQVIAAGRRRGVEPVLGFEDPNEYYLDRIGVQDYRDVEIYQTNLTVVSVWNYLYHEYAPTFQSNPKRGDRWMQAHCCADGQMPFLTPQLCDIGGASPVVNGDFSEVDRSTGVPLGWHLGHCQERGGTVTVVKGGAPGGFNAVRLTARAGEVAYLNVDSNTAGDGAYVPGRKYRFSALVKVTSGGAVRLSDAIFDSSWKSLGGVYFHYTAPDAAWHRVTRDYVMPKGATIVHYAFVVTGAGEAEVADMKVEELGPDGAAKPFCLKGDDAYTAFMSRWVDLYHGAGRDFLAYGRRIRPPKVVCGTTWHSFSTERNKFDAEVEAVCSAAYETLDGKRRALVLVNATDEEQTASWTWQGELTSLRLAPNEIRIVEF